MGTRYVVEVRDDYGRWIVCGAARSLEEAAEIALPHLQRGQDWQIVQIEKP